jgi:hypothetical protein
MTTAPGEPLIALDLPVAPPVTRAVAAPVRRPRGPAIGLLVLGVVLALGPIVGGLFAKVAAGQQMIDRFSPHMAPDALARYDADLDVLRRGAAAVDAVYRDQHVPAGRFPLLDEYRSQSAAINGRARTLLGRIEATQPDYRRVADIGGFDRIPFLIVACGIVAIYAASVLLTAGRSRAAPTILLVIVAATAIAVFPFAGNLHRGTRAGHRMLTSLSTVMTPVEVRQLQRDFVVIVEAVGQLDTAFRRVPQAPAPAADISALVRQWPTVSSDLASLVGTVNDDIADFNALAGLDRVTRPVGVSGLEAFPWLLAAVGAACAALALASRPRLQEST